MKHICLLGDSIFDNAKYVPRGGAVIDHLNAAIPTGWTAQLLARDGAVCASIADQVRYPCTIKNEAHVALSVGGNDALGWQWILSRPSESVGDALSQLSDMREEFRFRYVLALRSIKNHWPRLTVCTIYDCVPGLSDSMRTALSLFNEVILLEASIRNLRVIDLRKVCVLPICYSDFSPIEPSSIGGKKISESIIAAILAEDEK
jgi:hypothetical protein